MKYLVWLLAVGLLGGVALIVAGYCLWLTTTSLSYARVKTVENELLLFVGVFLLALASSVESVCHDTLDFIQVPGYPSAIRLFLLTHSRRNVVQR